MDTQTLTLMNGHTLQVPLSTPGKRFRHLPRLFKNVLADESDVLLIAPFAAAVVQSWSYEGDCTDPLTYEEFDATDLQCIWNALVNWWYGRIFQDPKNGESASSQP